MISELGQRILEKLPADGSKIGHTSLTRALGIDVNSDDYWNTVEDLDQQGLIERGRGRGGSLGRSGKDGIAAEAILVGEAEEKNLYKPIKEWFDSYWAQDYKPPDFYASVITASPLGHKRASGKWSRPDIAVVTVSGVEFFVPSKTLELTTIEVKRYADFGLHAVFETAAHSRIAHQSYLAVEWLDEADMDQAAGEIERILGEARRFRIGILQVRKKDEKWDVKEIITPERLNPEPQECSDFIEQQFGPYHKQLRSAIK